MTNRCKVASLGVCAIATASTLLNAEEIDTAKTSNPDIENIIVTAARSEQPIVASMASATVFTSTDIEMSQAASLPELLRRVPGLDIDQNGGRGAVSSIRIRGTESDQTLVLIDGVRVSSATNGATSIQHIPVSHIERIEVVRGPRSSLYGSEAIGGVIQIFTRTSQNGEDGISPTVRVEYGSQNTYVGEFSLAGKSGNTQYSISTAHEESDGIDNTVGSSGTDSDKDGYRETSLSATLGHTFTNDITVEARYLRSDGVSEFDGGANDETEFLNDSLSTSLSVPVNDTLVANFDISRARDERDTFGAFPSTFNTERDSASLQLNWQFTPAQTLTLGYDYHNDKVESTSNFVASERDNSAVFFNYLGGFGAFNMQTSLRNDDNQAFGRKTTGNAALGFEFAANSMVSLSYGTGFKAPTFNDLYFPFTDFGFGFTFEGNPDLAPETSESVEFLVQQSQENWNWSFAVYQTKIEDLIALTFTTVENISQADILGTEATLGMSLDQWRIDASLTYVDAINADTDARLENRARTKATVDVSRSFGRFDLAASWLYNGNRMDNGTELGGYALFDIRGSFRATKALTVGFKVKNLFDKDYTLITGFRTFRTEGQTALVFAQYRL